MCCTNEKYALSVDCCANACSVVGTLLAHETYKSFIGKQQYITDSCGIHDESLIGVLCNMPAGVSTISCSSVTWIKPSFLINSNRWCTTRFMFTQSENTLLCVCINFSFILPQSSSLAVFEMIFLKTYNYLHPLWCKALPYHWYLIFAVYTTRKYFAVWDKNIGQKFSPKWPCAEL